MPGPTLAISSKLYLQMIQRLMPVGTWAWNLATGQMAWSDSLHHMLGTDPAAHLPTQDDIVKRTHPDDRWIVEEKMRGGGAFGTKPTRLKARNGSYRWHLWHQEPIDRGGPLLFIGVVHDVHDSYSAHSLLEERQGILDTLTRLVGIMLWRADANGSLSFDNGWCEFTGTTLQDNREGKWALLLHPDDRGQALAAWDTALRTLGSYAISCRVRRADGHYVVMEMQAAPLLDSSGRLVEWVGFNMPKTGGRIPLLDQIAQGRPTNRELKAARALLGFSVQHLAQESGVSAATITRYEASDDVRIRESNLSKLRETLAANGASFAWDAEGRRSVCYRD